jgi:outer membrane lipoprotein LolB
MISLKFPPLDRAIAFVRAPALLACMLLAACAPVATRPGPQFDQADWAAREAGLSTDWDLRGRVALSQGDAAGNAGIRWQQRGADFDIQLSAPITHQNWRLYSRGGIARLEGLEGGVREGSDAEALLLEATGWRLPVAAMSDWVRGNRGVGAAASDTVTWDSQGRLATLQRDGLTIEFREWFDGPDPLPRKVYARRDGASVRLVIEAWEP